MFVLEFQSIYNEFFKGYFIANYDGYTLDLSTIPDMIANVTTIRLMNPDNIAVNEYPSNRKFYSNQMTVSLPSVSFE